MEPCPLCGEGEAGGDRPGAPPQVSGRCWTAGVWSGLAHAPPTASPLVLTLPIPASHRTVKNPPNGALLLLADETPTTDAVFHLISHPRRGAAPAVTPTRRSPAQEQTLKMTGWLFPSRLRATRIFLVAPMLAMQPSHGIAWAERRLGTQPTLPTAPGCTVIPIRNTADDLDT